MVELGNHAGQPVGPQRLRGDTSTPPSPSTVMESSVASSAPESASRSSQYRSSPNARWTWSTVPSYSAAMSKERGIADARYRYRPWSVRISRARRSRVRRAARAVDHAADRARRAPPDHVRHHREGRRRAARTARGRPAERVAGARRWLQRRDRRRPDRPDRRPRWPTPRSPSTAPWCAPRRARCGTTSSSPRWRTASAAWSACRASPDRRARRRCRTSAPTAPRWPTPSAGCGCSTAAPARTAGWRPTRCGFGYRHSVLKNSQRRRRARGRVHPGRRRAAARRCATASWPTALGVEPGARADPTRVREAVLALRAGKGMVLDDADHDTWSVGSFFTNPVVTRGRVRAAPAEHRRPVPNYPAPGRGEAGGGLAGRAGRVRQGLSRVTALRRGCPPSTRWR